MNELHTLFERFLSGNIPENELLPGYNGMIALPLSEVIDAKGFINCPAGVVITSKGLWIAHLPFMDHVKDTASLWNDLYDVEKIYGAYALGSNEDRLNYLTEAIKKKAKITDVETSRLQPHATGIYNLRITQENKNIIIEFYETGAEDNKISKRVLLD
ncbi:MAG: hypothetical protein H6772_01995 [Pseudomonadales bacterium]|nr:hypothetical protein [Pseudomonadales bacterium]